MAGPVKISDEVAKALSDALRSPVTFERIDQFLRERAKEHDEAYKTLAVLALTDDTGEMRNKAHVRLGRFRECQALIELLERWSK